MKAFFGIQPSVLLYGCCALSQNTIDIKLKTGTFRGLSTPNGTEKWLGIPFALPPIGQLRFKAPIPITKTSSSIMDASTFGNACPQPAATLGAPIAEDCLFLNVDTRSSFFYIFKLIPARSGGPKGWRKGPNCLYSFGYTWVLDLNSLSGWRIMNTTGRRLYQWVRPGAVNSLNRTWRNLRSASQPGFDPTGVLFFILISRFSGMWD